MNTNNYSRGEPVTTCLRYPEAFTSTLKRNGVPGEFTAYLLGHSDIRTTAHYLDSLSKDESFEVNNKLVKRKTTKEGDEDKFNKNK